MTEKAVARLISRLIFCTCLQPFREQVVSEGGIYGEDGSAQKDYALLLAPREGHIAWRVFPPS